jgi:MFS family permease
VEVRREGGDKVLALFRCTQLVLYPDRPEDGSAESTGRPAGPVLVQALEIYVNAPPAQAGLVAQVRVALALLVLELAFGLVFAWGAASPFVSAQDHWPPLLLGLVYSAVPVGFGAGVVVAGRLADRHPPRRICWLAVGVMAVGFAVAFVVPTGLTFVVFYSGIGLGVGAGLALAGGVAAGVYVFPSRSGMVGGALTGVYALAGLIHAPLISQLSSRIGWLNAIRLVGTGLLVSAAVAMLFMPGIPRPASIRTGWARPGVRALAARPGVWTGFLVTALTVPVGAFAFVNLAIYAGFLAMPSWVGTLAILLLVLGNATGRLLGGTVADRVSPDLVLLATLLCASGSAALLFRPFGIPGVLVAAGFGGLAFGVPAGVASRLASEAAPDAPNSAFGLLIAGYSTGSFIGPLLGAVVAGFPTVWLILGGLPVLALLPLGYRAAVVRPMRKHGLDAPEHTMLGSDRGPANNGTPPTTRF